MKCEVLKDCRLVIKKGSIVEIEPFQFEAAKEYLKPIKEEKKKPIKNESK